MKSNLAGNQPPTIHKYTKLMLTTLTFAFALWLIACGGSAGNAQFFVQKGCVECHSVSVYGLESQNKSGPDLALAAADVKQRFGKDLEQFMLQPTGTMQMVLTQKIKLTDGERREAIEQLELAYKKKMEQEKSAK